MIERIKLWLSTKSLAFKLIASNIICVSIGFAILAIFIFGRSQHMIKSQIRESAQRTTQSYAADMTYLFTDTEQIVLIAKNALVKISEGQDRLIKAVLREALNTTSHSDLNFTDAWVYVFEKENVSSGLLFFSQANDNESADFTKENVTDFYNRFPWFQGIPKEEKIFWSEPYIDIKSKKTIVTCLMPFRFNENHLLNGFVALSVDLTDIKKDMENFSSHENGYLLLFSKNGVYVNHPDSEIALKKTIFDIAKEKNLPKLAEIGTDLKYGKSGAVELPFSSIVKGEGIFFYAPIIKNRWGVGLVYAKNKLFRPLREFLFAAGLAIFVGMAVLLIFINFICRRSTEQLSVLSKLAAKYSAGDFSSNFEKMPNSKEVSALSKAMSDMRINILDYIEKEKNTASERQKIQSEMDFARSIQKATMSANHPKHEAFKVNTLMLPAKKVSGDFYDFFFVGKDKFVFVVADVSGKNVPAALYMMKSQALIKNVMKSNKKISQVFDLVNQELYEGNDSCMFVSAFMGVVNVNTGEMEYINAGHPHPFINKGKGYKMMNVKNNIVLGVKRDAKFVSQKVKLSKNDRIFVYTDGVTEAEDKKFHFYGEDRLIKQLSKNSKKPLRDVLNDIRLFAAGRSQSDDITMLEFIFLGKGKKSISITADMTNLGEVLDFVSEDMENKDIPKQKRFNMTVAAEEIFSNIALYAKTVDKIDISTKLEKGEYVITFEDDGQKYNPLTREDPNVMIPLEERNVGGLGIFIVKKVADIVKYNYKNKKNILKVGVRV